MLQEEPHVDSRKPSAGRLASLEWLLEHGADPELRGAWPSARAIVIAGFAGARDTGGLTALHCAAGSRVPGAERHAIARMLLDAGAEVPATVHSWNHDVDAIYFAAGTKDHAVFDLLMERGADATGGLCCALWAGAYDLAESAPVHGAQADRATSNGRPLLNDLIRWGQFKPAYWLLGRARDFAPSSQPAPTRRAAIPPAKRSHAQRKAGGVVGEMRSQEPGVRSQTRRVHSRIKGRDQAAGANCGARRSQKSSNRPLSLEQRRAMIALAPEMVQCMPVRLSRVPMTILQPASSTPVEVHKP